MGLERRQQRGAGRTFTSLLAGATLVLVFAGPVTAAGESTPGVTVTAVNPAQSQTGSDLDIALVVRTERSAMDDASCRPQDATIECWGSLVLRLPKFGDLALGGFEVHRVAVGDIACDDEEDEGDGCDHVMGVVSSAADPVVAQVNGIAVVKWPGSTGLAVGTKLQLKLTLTDNGRGPYADQIVVQVYRFVEGPMKPLLYRSGPETIRQIEIRGVSGAG